MYSESTLPLLVGYASRGKDAVLTAPAGKQSIVFSARVFNRSGGAIDAGIVRKFAESTQSYKFFTFDGTDYVDASASVFAGTATTGISTSLGHGFVVASKRRSGLIGLNVSQASATGAYVFEYYNGSAWTTLTTVAAPAFTGTGNIFLSFLPPNDWAKGGNADLDSTMYGIRVTTAVTPAGTAVQFNDLWVGELIEFVEGLADNSGLQIEFDVLKPFVLEANEGLMPYFGSASANNGMQIAYASI
jgi:hypothetical protein